MYEPMRKKLLNDTQEMWSLALFNENEKGMREWDWA